MTDLEGAVERVKQSRDRARQSAERGDIFDANPQLAAIAIEASRYANAIDTILDALASITRERDDAVADKHNLIATQGEELVRIGLARDSEKAGAAEKIDRLTRERDAMREGLKPFAAVAARYKTGGLSADIKQRSPDLSKLLLAQHFYRAAALVNGEGGK